MAAAVVGLTGAVISAGPAAAHTPTWDVTCTAVTVDLTNYTPDAPNTVTVSVVDGKTLLETTEFGKEYHTDKPLVVPPHDKALTIRLVVKDGDGNDKYSRDETKQSPVCDENKPSPTPTETAPSTPPASEVPSPSATPSSTPSETAPETAPSEAAPSPSSPDLAETGSSSATPIIGGAALAVLLAGGGILWSVRKRRASAQH